MADHDDEIRPEDVQTEEKADANENIADLEPKKDVKGGFVRM